MRVVHGGLRPRFTPGEEQSGRQEEQGRTARAHYSPTLRTPAWQLSHFVETGRNTMLFALEPLGEE
jgi:hypothetical protein